jgi:hypothetical protein
MQQILHAHLVVLDLGHAIKQKAASRDKRQREAEDPFQIEEKQSGSAECGILSWTLEQIEGVSQRSQRFE